MLLTLTACGAHEPGASGRPQQLTALRVVPSRHGADSALAGAAIYRNRHTCVLLPIDAVLNALKRE